jgi:hypothetical protein
MKVTFEVPDEHVESIEEYLKTQARYEMDDLTKTQRLVHLYKSPVHFLQDALHQVVHQVVQQHPTAAMREKLAAVKKLQDEIKEQAKPSIVAGS